MLNKSMLFVVVLTLSSFALAQHKTQQQAMAEASHSPDATTTCDVTYASGTGQNATQFCVTVNGNIPQFSVGGEEMIFVGQIGEGYGICDTTTDIAYYDYAYADSGNWNPSTISVSGNTVTVTRLTSDGIWKLKQTIVNTPATATGPGSAKVTMALKNLSGVARFAYLLRFADVDADGTPSPNDFDYTSQTAYGLYPDFGRGLSSTNGTFNSSVGQLAYAQDTFEGPAPCNPFGNLAAEPFSGDGSTAQFWDESLGHNATLTAVSTYKGI